MVERIPVVCRTARAEDKPAVLEMTSRIWEGHDYIQYVWDEWLADPVGQLTVAEANGRIVGMAKLSRMRPGEWLLGGLRTHPDLEGRGIATQVHHYLLDLWDQIGEGTLRLLTSSKRLPVHHLCASTGFDKVAEFTKYRAPALEDQVHSFHPTRADEIDAALKFVLASPLLPLQYGLMNTDWSYMPPDAEILKEAAQAGHAYWWKPGSEQGYREGFLTAYEETDEIEEGAGEQRIYFLQLAACSLEALGDLLVDFRRLAAERDCQYVHYLAAPFPEIQPHLQAAGYERAWDASVYVFARPHPMRGAPGSE